MIRKNTWEPYPVFKMIQQMGRVPEDEMYRVFNMGIGMIAVIDKKNKRYMRSGKQIGEIISGKPGVTIT